MVLILALSLMVTLFCLFQPNIVYLIHKEHFNWKKNNEEKKDYRLK